MQVIHHFLYNKKNQWIEMGCTYPEKTIMVQYMYFRICIRSKISTHVWNR